MKKEIGIIGLGKMGMNIAERLVIDKGYTVVGYDRGEEAISEAEEKGVRSVASIEELVGSLSLPAVILLAVPHKAVDSVLEEIGCHGVAETVIIDGANAYYKDSRRRAEEMEEKRIQFLDAGISGGPGGAREGSCIMVGGEREVYDRVEELFRDLALEDGYRYVGSSGAGHFVKMVHNGIEYGMMQSIAEGFALMKESDFDVDLKETADLYNHGSVIQSRLTGWLKDGYDMYGTELEEISGEVSHSGMGQWTVETGKEMNIETPSITAALEARVHSQGNPSYTGKVVSLLRTMFGGHDVSKK